MSENPCYLCLKNQDIKELLALLRKNPQYYNLFLFTRCSLQAKLYVSGEDHPQASVPSLCSHLPSAF